jgi:hypothetical protein
MILDVTKCPEWRDFPWAMLIPRWCEVRWAPVPEEDLAAGVAPGHYLFLVADLSESNIFHCDIHLLSLDEVHEVEFHSRVLAPMLRNLGGSIFEHYHPGEYMPMIKRRVKFAAAGNEGYPPEDKTLWIEAISLGIG